MTTDDDALNQARSFLDPAPPAGGHVVTAVPMTTPSPPPSQPPSPMLGKAGLAVGAVIALSLLKIAFTTPSVEVNEATPATPAPSSTTAPASTTTTSPTSTTTPKPPAPLEVRWEGLEQPTGPLGPAGAIVGEPVAAPKVPFRSVGNASYLWERCAGSSGSAKCTPIKGGTKAEWTVGGVPIGHSVRVRVTATPAGTDQAVTFWSKKLRVVA